MSTPQPVTLGRMLSRLGGGKSALERLKLLRERGLIDLERHPGLGYGLGSYSRYAPDSLERIHTIERVLKKRRSLDLAMLRLWSEGFVTGDAQRRRLLLVCVRSLEELIGNEPDRPRIMGWLKANKRKVGQNAIWKYVTSISGSKQTEQVVTSLILASQGIQSEWRLQRFYDVAVPLIDSIKLVADCASPLKSLGIETPSSDSLAASLADLTRLGFMQPNHLRHCIRDYTSEDLEALQRLYLVLEWRWHDIERFFDEMGIPIAAEVFRSLSPFATYETMPILVVGLIGILSAFNLTPYQFLKVCPEYNQ